MFFVLVFLAGVIFITLGMIFFFLNLSTGFGFDRFLISTIFAIIVIALGLFLVSKSKVEYEPHDKI